MEKEDLYFTIANPSEGIYKEKGSKFFGYAYHVQTEDDINSIISELKKVHHNARHVCFAWVLGTDRSMHRANDANEPKNTAGKPILGQIDAYHLTNVLVAVVRYFGGTKLGTSGLVNAYKTTATNALRNAKQIEKSIYERYEVTFEHQAMNEVMQIIKGQKLEQLEQDFGLSNKVVIAVRKSEAEKIVYLFKRTPGIKINQIKT